MILPENPTKNSLIQLLKYSGKTDIDEVDLFVDDMLHHGIEVFVMSGYDVEDKYCIGE